MCDYLHDILPVEMRDIVRSFLGTVDRIRLAQSCTLLAEEDAAFVALPPVLAVNVLTLEKTGPMRRLRQSFFLALLTARHVPAIVWLLSLTDRVSFTLDEMLPMGTHTFQLNIIPSRHAPSLSRTLMITFNGIESCSSVVVSGNDYKTMMTSDHAGKDNFPTSITHFLRRIEELYRADMSLT